MFVRSTLPGSGLGYVWHEPGDVVEMPEEHAAVLVAIEPDRFAVTVEDPRPPADDNPQDDDPAADPADETKAAAKAPAKRAQPRKTPVTE